MICPYQPRNKHKTQEHNNRKRKIREAHRAPAKERGMVQIQQNGSQERNNCYRSEPVPSLGKTDARHALIPARQHETDERITIQGANGYETFCTERVPRIHSTIPGGRARARSQGPIKNRNKMAAAASPRDSEIELRLPRIPVRRMVEIPTKARKSNPYGIRSFHQRNWSATTSRQALHTVDSCPDRVT